MMMRSTFTDLPFIELRRRLKVRADNLHGDNSWNLDDVLNYLVTLPDSVHTADSVGALIQLSRSLFYAGRSSEMFKAASHASRLARRINDKGLLGRARDKEGAALTYLGRLTEATVAQVDAWSLARETGDRKLELFAVWGISEICATMGQWHQAIRYSRRVQQLAEEIGDANLEAAALTCIAENALQLRDPQLGLEALAGLGTREPSSRTEAVIQSEFLAAQSQLYLQTKNLTAARKGAEQASEIAAASDNQVVILKCRALQGLIQVSSEDIKEGLATLRNCLDVVRLNWHQEIPRLLSMCVDACETAGYADEALSYLQELVDWKRAWIETVVMPHQQIELPKSLMYSPSDLVSDRGVVAQSHLLHANILDRVQRFVETAINAEIARGLDIYRVFRVAQLARYLAQVLGWKEERMHRLSIGAQLCSIGMLAVPSNVLQKPGQLSNAELQLIRDHARYGAELLRRSNLQALEIAALIAEQYRERYNGHGYPRGLSGEEISEEARVVAVCDAFEAMTHRRPWRSTVMTVEAALEEVHECSGAQFDPQFAKLFIDLFQNELLRRPDLDAFLAQGADEFEYVRARARMETLVQ